MNSRFFFNVDHARQYMRGCVVYHDGRMKYVHEVNRRGDAYMLKLLEMEELWRGRINRLGEDEDEPPRVNFDDKALKVLPDQLGWMTLPANWNYDGEAAAVFIKRIPVRSWKIGLHRDNLQGVGRGVYDGYHLSGDVITHIPCVASFFDNSYATLDEAVDLLDEDKGTRQIPISRGWMIEKGGDVYYGSLSSPVGELGNSRIVLNKNRDFLREALEMEGIPC